MQPFNLATMRAALTEGRIEWRKHVLQKLAERGISQKTVIEVLSGGDRLRDYPEDRPFASALFLGYADARPIHVVAACDEAARMVYVITAYEPSLDVFEADYRTRRKP